MDMKNKRRKLDPYISLEIVGNLLNAASAYYMRIVRYKYDPQSAPDSSEYVNRFIPFLYHLLLDQEFISESQHVIGIQFPNNQIARLQAKDKRLYPGQGEDFIITFGSIMLIADLLKQRVWVGYGEGKLDNPTGLITNIDTILTTQLKNPKRLDDKGWSQQSREIILLPAEGFPARPERR